MSYTSAMLARLAYSHAAYELSERLVSAAATYGDEYGRGAFLAEESATILSEATALLDAAVVADRLRGALWHAVAEAADLSSDAAEDRFGSAERQFREALLFPHRYPEHVGLGTRWRPTRSSSPIACESSSTSGSSTTATAAARIAMSRNPSPGGWP